MNIKQERHKVAKALRHKEEIKNSVLRCFDAESDRIVEPLCLSALVPDKKGFTLIELMAVIAIILLLASIMIPNIVKNVERGREARAKADIDILVKAVSLFQIDNSKLPKNLSNLWDKTGQGPYISTDQTKSLATPWGGSYSLTDEGNAYTIIATDEGGKTIEKVSKTITFE